MDSGDEKAEAPRVNEATIVDGVLVVKIYLDHPGKLAMALGSLELAKKVAESYFHQQAMRDAQVRSAIIRPGQAN